MSRRKGRYERRKAKRLQQRIERCDALGGLENVFTYDAMYLAGKKCCNGVRWKTSTQNFELHIFSGTAKRTRQVLNQTWKSGKYVHFTITERGKTRPIDAPHISDRQVHKVMAQKVLVPLYSPEMIYNNGASLKGKGFEFCVAQLKNDLHRHFRKYGREGYIILVDFKQFFPSVSHEQIFRRHEKFIFDDALRRLAGDIVRTMPGDYGLPLGVEPSQFEMVAFPSALDNYIKCQLSIKGAGHYMDDYYVIVPPDRDPKEIMARIIEKAAEIELQVSHEKSRIIPLRRPFRYCKAKFSLKPTGKVIVNGSPKSMQRARRKMRAFKDLVDSGEMTYEQLWTSVNSSLSYFAKYNDHGRVLRLRQLFYSLFGFSPERYDNFRGR